MANKTDKQLLNEINQKTKEELILAILFGGICGFLAGILFTVLFHKVVL